MDIYPKRLLTPVWICCNQQILFLVFSSFSLFSAFSLFDYYYAVLLRTKMTYDATLSVDIESIPIQNGEVV